MKIVTIVGARPQFIKAAVLSRELAKYPQINEVIIHTGQHYDANMSDVFFKELDIPTPNYNLSVANLSHGAMTGRMMEGIEEVLLKEKPDFVLVYGDTNSTLAGAIAAKKLHVKIAHIEAGLRSFDMRMPEEVNRILTDRISDFLFCPTNQAVLNLQNEGFDQFECKIHQTGDIMYDAVLFYAQKAENMAEVMEQVPKENYLLSTIHRAENTDNPKRLRSIFAALDEINKKVKILLPLHPRTRSIMQRESIKTEVSIIDPVGYLLMSQLTKNAQMVITDSGGLQKEAYFFGKKSIVLRDTTEWVELVKGNFTILTGAGSEKIAEGFANLYNSTLDFSTQLYGTGTCASKIIEALTNAA